MCIWQRLKALYARTNGLVSAEHYTINTITNTCSIGKLKYYFNMDCLNLFRLIFYQGVADCFVYAPWQRSLCKRSSDHQLVLLLIARITIFQLFQLGISSDDDELLRHKAESFKWRAAYHKSFLHKIIQRDSLTSTKLVALETVDRTVYTIGLGHALFLYYFKHLDTDFSSGIRLFLTNCNSIGRLGSLQYAIRN